MQTFRMFSLIMLVAGLIAAMPVQVRAEYITPSPAHDREQPGLTDPAELETFIDDLLAAQSVAFVWFLQYWNLLGVI